MLLFLRLIHILPIPSLLNPKFFPSPSFIITFSIYTDSCLSFFALLVALFLFFLPFHGIPRLTTMFTRTCHFSASCVAWIASTFSCPIYLRSISVLFTNLCMDIHICVCVCVCVCMCICRSPKVLWQFYVHVSSVPCFQRASYILFISVLWNNW